MWHEDSQLHSVSASFVPTYAVCWLSVFSALNMQIITTRALGADGRTD